MPVQGLRSQIPDLRKQIRRCRQPRGQERKTRIINVRETVLAIPGLAAECLRLSGEL